MKDTTHKYAKLITKNLQDLAAALESRITITDTDMKLWQTTKDRITALSKQDIFSKADKEQIAALADGFSRLVHITQKDLND